MPAVAIFGLSGGTGRTLAREADRRGWPVSGLYRAASAIGSLPHGVRVVRGDLTDPAALDRVLDGAGAALCVFGPRPPYAVFCAAATEAIVGAARRRGVSRLVCQTGAMIGSYPANRTRIFQFLASQFASRNPALARDREEQEAAARNSGLDWTLVKPPRLTNAPSAGLIRAGPALRVGLMSRVARADLARLLLDEVAVPRFLGQAVFVRR